MTLLGGSMIFASGCAELSETAGDGPSDYVLASVVIDADGNRTSYVQTITSLDDGPFTNDHAIEIPGNGVFLAGERHFFVGLAESPTWIRYTVDDTGKISETGRLSLLNFGVTRIDPIGQPFDPSRHEAVATLAATATHPPGTVAGIVRPGYLIGDEVLRPAAVAVSE